MGPVLQFNVESIDQFVADFGGDCDRSRFGQAGNACGEVDTRAEEIEFIDDHLAHVRAQRKGKRLCV